MNDKPGCLDLIGLLIFSIGIAIVRASMELIASQKIRNTIINELKKAKVI